MRRYGNVNSLNDLERARAGVAKRLKLQEAKLRMDTESLKKSFTGGSLLMSGIRTASRLVSPDKLALLALAMLKKKLFRKGR